MLLIDYIYWHYAIAPIGILGLLRNYTLGTWHKFLIATHFRTLLAPWHRAQPSGLRTATTFGDKVLNAIVYFYIRIIAAVIRLIIILTGLVFELVIIAAFAALFIVWLLWPVIFVYLIIKGSSLIINDPYDHGYGIRF